MQHPIGQRVRVARALSPDAAEPRERASWVVVGGAILMIMALWTLRAMPAWALSTREDPKVEDAAIVRVDDDEDGDHVVLLDDDTDTDGDQTGVTGTTGRSDPGSLTDGNRHTGPTGNTGTYTDGRGATGPTNDTSPRDGTLTDGRYHTGPTGNTNTATDGRG